MAQPGHASCSDYHSGSECPRSPTAKAQRIPFSDDLIDAILQRTCQWCAFAWRHIIFDSYGFYRRRPRVAEWLLWPTIWQRYYLRPTIRKLSLRKLPQKQYMYCIYGKHWRWESSCWWFMLSFIYVSVLSGLRERERESWHPLMEKLQNTGEKNQRSLQWIVGHPGDRTH